MQIYVYVYTHICRLCMCNIDIDISGCLSICHIQHLWMYMRRGYADNPWNLSCFNHPWASGQIQESCNCKGNLNTWLPRWKISLKGKEVILWCFLRCIPKRCFLEESSCPPLLWTAALARHLCIVKSFQVADFTQAQPLQVNPWSHRGPISARPSQGSNTKVMNRLHFISGFSLNIQRCAKEKITTPNLPSHLLPTKKLAIYHWTCVSRRRHCLDAR